MFCAGDKELNCGGNNEVGVFKVSSLHVVVLDVSFAWLCLAFSCSRSCPSRHLTLNTWAATMTTTVIGAVLLCGMFTKCFLLSPPNTTIIFRIYDTEMVDINVPNISPVSCARECLAWRSSYTYVGLQSGTSVKTIAPAFSFSPAQRSFHMYSVTVGTVPQHQTCRLQRQNAAASAMGTDPTNVEPTWRWTSIR